MRFLSSFLILGFFAIVGTAQAQHRKSPTRNSAKTPSAVVKASPNVHSLIEQYDWAKAISALQSLVNSAKEATTKDSLEVLLRNARRAEEMMASTQQIVFIDSVVVEKSQLLSALKLSEDAGQLLPTSQVFPKKSNSPLWSAVSFINPLASTAIFAAPSNNAQRLQAVFRAGNGWTTASLLAGIDSLFVKPDYPFLLSDGTTLYFSAQGTESIGGTDIFVTRYNPETRQYVKPTNVGMPFNSPANEYLYAVDPSTGIGVLASDRRQPKDKVCIYSFIVPSERKDYDAESISIETLRNRAQIASISATQQGQSRIIKSAAQRKSQQSTAKAQNLVPSFRFVVSDNQVCHSEADFKSPEARALVKQWLNLFQQKQALQQQGDAAELQYARQRTAENRNHLATTMQKLTEVSQQEKELAHKIRSLELTR